MAMTNKAHQSENSPSFVIFQNVKAFKRILRSFSWPCSQLFGPLLAILLFSSRKIIIDVGKGRDPSVTVKRTCSIHNILQVLEFPKGAFPSQVPENINIQYYLNSYPFEKLVLGSMRSEKHWDIKVSEFLSYWNSWSL